MKKFLFGILALVAMAPVSGCQSKEELKQYQFASEMKEAAYQQVSDNVFYTNTDDHDVLNEQIKLILKEHPEYEVDDISQLMSYIGADFYTDGVYVVLKKKQ